MGKEEENLRRRIWREEEEEGVCGGKSKLRGENKVECACGGGKGR